MKKITLMLICILPIAANATILKWDATSGGNDHCYQLVVGDELTWCQAKTAAENSTHLGTTGHLATITSAQEQTFIVTQIFATGTIGTTNTIYLGGFQPEGTDEPDQGWQWITGEIWNYTHWRYSEPNNNGENGRDEDCLSIYWSPDITFNGYWNDGRMDKPHLGYIIEYPTPEPATILMLSLGALTLKKNNN